MGTILVSWLGRTDLRAVAESQQVGVGPVAQALQTGRFSRLELICDYGPDEAAPYLAWLQDQFQAAVTPHYVTLDSPTDFGAIYRHARQVVAETLAKKQAADGLAFHLSPGTPAMAAVWIILAKTRFPAELIESSIRCGVRTASVPFDIAADFLPDLLARPDRELARLTAGLPPAAPAFSMPSLSKPRDATGHCPRPPPGRAALNPGPDRGRVRHRQGTPRTRHPPGQPQARPSVRHRQLRRHRPGAGRV
jgi:hypothetical protein